MADKTHGRITNLIREDAIQSKLIVVFWSCYRGRRCFYRQCAAFRKKMVLQLFWKEHKVWRLSHWQQHKQNGKSSSTPTLVPFYIAEHTFMIEYIVSWKRASWFIWQIKQIIVREVRFPCRASYPSCCRGSIILLANIICISRHCPYWQFPD